MKFIFRLKPETDSNYLYKLKLLAKMSVNFDFKA